MTEGDRRNERRSCVLKGGKLIFQNRTIVLDCSVRNLTPAGAHIRTAALRLPVDLELLVTSDQLMYPAKVQWQKGTEAGPDRLKEHRPGNGG